MNKFLQKTKEHFRHVIEIKKNPHSIAFGFAIGTFLALLPTPGFSIILGVILTLIFTRLSKISLFGAFIVWNPIFAVPIYAFSYGIGSYILEGMPSGIFELVFLNNLYYFSVRLIIGSLIVSVMLSAMSYALVYIVSDYYIRRRKKQRYGKRRIKSL